MWLPFTMPIMPIRAAALLALAATPLAGQSPRVAITPTVAYVQPMTVYEGPWSFDIANASLPFRYRARVQGHVAVGGTVSVHPGPTGFVVQAGATFGSARAALRDCRGGLCDDFTRDASLLRAAAGVRWRFAPAWAMGTALEPGAGVAVTRTTLQPVPPTSLAPEYRGVSTDPTLGLGLSRSLGRRLRLRLDVDATRVRTDLESFEGFLRADDTARTVYVRSYTDSYASWLWTTSLGLSIELP